MAVAAQLETQRSISVGILLIISTSVVHADLATELPTTLYPVEGATGPHTYLADSSLVGCDVLAPSPTVVPWNPTFDEAKTLCSSLPACGGFLYTTATASSAAGGSALATASYCQPQTFSSGTASATSAVSFVRYLYGSCDVTASLAISTSTFYGTLSGTRSVCLRPGRGLSKARDRSPKPNAVRHRTRPKMTVNLAGADYEVGKVAFRTEDEARNVSADGATHSMMTGSGITYYMAGFPHADRAQSELPFTVDGYYPLYNSAAAAEAASIRGNGNGLSTALGATQTSGPRRWTIAPYAQTYYMPVDGATLYTGDYVAPFALDGYYPLYLESSAAQKASSDGSVQSHGPGAETGHPMSWSTGEYRVFYMPSSGNRYYGTYQSEQPATPSPLYDFAAVLPVKATPGEGLEQAAAAQAIAAATELTITLAAASTIAR